MENKKGRIKILKDGPYSVRGGLPLAKEIIVADENGDSVGFKKEGPIERTHEYSLCQCGKSANKPFCNGCHIDEKFNDGDDSLK